MQKRKKWFLPIGIIAATVFIIAGCDDGGGGSPPPADVPITSIQIVDGSFNFNVDSDPRSLTANVLPVNASNRNVTWESDDPTVATVNAAGVVTPVAIGTTRIIATAVGTDAQGRTHYYYITVGVYAAGTPPPNPGDDLDDNDEDEVIVPPPPPPGTPGGNDTAPPAAGVIYTWRATEVTDGDGFSFTNAASREVGSLNWQRLAGATGTAIDVTNTGAAVPTGSRLLIGGPTATSVPANTSGTNHHEGTLNLFPVTKVTIEYNNLEGNLVHILVNNTTTSQGNSVHGNASRVFNGGRTAASGRTELAEAGTIEFTVDPSSFNNSNYMQTATLQIRIGDGSNPTSINITSITLERLSD